MSRSPQRPRVRARIVAGLLLVSVAALGGVARTRADEGSAAAALLAVTSADPMDYALTARRVGDAALVRLLTGEDVTVEVRLAAVRAAPHARAPEHLLAALVELGHGTDPALAPAALTSAFQVAQALQFHLLEQRESDPEVLDAPVERLRELGDDDEARADLRQLALHAAARLMAVRRDATE